jgi:hypothetical protein
MNQVKQQVKLKNIAKSNSSQSPFKGNLDWKAHLIHHYFLWFPVFVFECLHLNISFTITYSTFGIDEGSTCAQ